MKYLIVAIFVLAGIFLELFSLFSNPQILGLFIDIIGAYYLAQSFIIKTKEDIRTEAFGTRSKGVSEIGEESLYIQTIDARTGFVIITFGFIIQGIGIHITDLEIPQYFGIALILLVFLVVCNIHRVLLKNERIFSKIDEEERRGIDNEE